MSVRIKLIVLLALLMSPSIGRAQISDREFFEQRDQLSYDSIARYTGIIREVNGKQGFQTVLGEWLIQPEYDWMELHYNSILPVPRFNNGRLLVRKDNKYGVISIYGKTIIPCVHFRIQDWGDMYMIENEKEERAFFSLDGTQLSKFGEFESGYVSPDAEPEPENPDSPYRDRNIKDAAENVVLRLSSAPYMIEIGEENEGFTMVLFYPYNRYSADGGRSKGVYGFLDKKGEWAVEPSLSYWFYGNAYYEKPRELLFHSGVAMVPLQGNSKYQYIDTTGRVIFEPDTTLGVPEAYAFNDLGYGIVTYGRSGQNSRVYYYNTDGSVRFRTTDSMSVDMAGLAWGPTTEYLGHLSLYNRFTKEYILYNEDLTKEVFRFSIKDSVPSNPNRKLQVHFNSYAVALVRKCSDEELDLDTKIMSLDGELLQDWQPYTTTYDVLTDTYVIRTEGGVRLERGKTRELLYSCDSCRCGHGYDLRHLGSGFQGCYGVFTISTGSGVNAKTFQVNYKGEIIYQYTEYKPKTLERSPTFYYFAKDFLKPEVTGRTTKMNADQAYFDKLYVKLGWEKIRKVKQEPYKPKKSTNKRGNEIMFTPPVIIDEE